VKGNGILQAGERASAPLKAQTSTPHRILVVEDDISLRRLNTQVLSRSGYEVDGAADGAIAWQALSTDCYDLLVTAHDIPKLTGVELVRKVRAARMVLPVVMATGTLPKEEFTRQPWLQPAAMLPKPYTAEEMLRTVKKVLHEADSFPGGS
jgi:DNA-binding response OmpR family regulator